jgi:hypothetical protein
VLVGLAVHGGLGEHGAGLLIGGCQQVHGLPGPWVWGVWRAESLAPQPPAQPSSPG